MEEWEYSPPEGGVAAPVPARPGWSFHLRRQHGINRFTDNLFCAECDTAIETDVASTLRTWRAVSLEAEGIVILGFENRILFQNIEAALPTIREGCKTTRG